MATLVAASCSLLGALLLLLAGPSAALQPNPAAAVWVDTLAASNATAVAGLASYGEMTYVVGTATGALEGVSAPAGVPYAFLQAYGADGGLQWTQSLVATRSASGAAVAATSDSVYVAGQFSGSIGGEPSHHVNDFDVFVARLATNGSVLWIRAFGSFGTDDPVDMAVAGEAVAVAGNTYGAMEGWPASGLDAFLAVFNPYGSLVAVRQFGSTSSGGDTVDDRVYSLSSDGSRFYVAGSSYSVWFKHAGRVWAFEANGTLVWTVTAPTYLREVASVSAVGGSVVLAWTASAGPNGERLADTTEIVVASYSKAGQMEWWRSCGTSLPDAATAVSADGVLVVVGGVSLTYSSSRYYADALVCGWRNSGAPLWQMEFGGWGDDRLGRVDVEMGRLRVAGTTTGPLLGVNPIAYYGSGFVARLSMPPSACVTAFPSVGTVDTAFFLDASPSASALSGGGGSLEYAWDFNRDGSVDTAWSAIPFAAWAPAAPGTHEARVQVRNVYGQRAEANITVEVVPPVIVTAGASAPRWADGAFEVVFGAGASGGQGPYSFEWRFGGGGGFAVGPSAVRSFAPGSTLTAVVTVSDSLRQRASMELSISIPPTPLAVRVEADAAVADLSTPIRFGAAASGGVPPYSFSWAFGDGPAGDGPAGDGPDVWHTFLSVGGHWAEVAVTDTVGASASARVGVAVNPAPLAVSITADPPGGLVPLRATLSATVGGAVSPYHLVWTVAEDTYIDLESVTYNFDRAGAFNVTLAVFDAAGRSVSAQTVVSVRPPPLRAAAECSPSNGTAPLTVRFSGSSTGGSGGLTESWAVGEGRPQLAGSAEHTYGLPGTYTARYTVRDLRGVTSAAPCMVEVRAPVSVRAWVDKPVGPLPSTSSFFADAQGGTPPYSFEWLFDASSDAVGPRGNYTFRTGGAHAVWVQVTDAVGQKAVATLVVQTVSGPPTTWEDRPVETLPEGNDSVADLALCTMSVAAGCAIALVWERRRRPPDSNGGT